MQTVCCKPHAFRFVVSDYVVSIRYHIGIRRGGVTYGRARCSRRTALSCNIFYYFAIVPRTPPASKNTYTYTKLDGENSKSAAFFGVTSLPDVHLRARVSWASFPVDTVLVSSVHHSNE